MALKVGRIPYLEFEPFYFDMPHRGILLDDMVPSALAASAEQGQTDAGPVSLVHWWRLKDRFQPLEGFCVATTERSGSRLLYSKQPIQELTGARIAISGEAATSFHLLRVLLGLKYRVKPAAYVTLEEPNDAILLIGNAALRRRRGVRGYPHRYDLGAEWYGWTGLPFVYARWVARNDLAVKDIEQLEGALYVGLEDGVDALYHLAEPREDVLMLPRDVVEHIQVVRYYVGVSEQKAMDLFRQYLDQLDPAT